MLQTELRRGAAEGRDEPCTVCEPSDEWGLVIACAHLDGSGAVRLWRSQPQAKRPFVVCGPGRHADDTSGECRGSAYLSLSDAQVEFHHRAALLGRAE